MHKGDHYKGQERMIGLTIFKAMPVLKAFNHSKEPSLANDYCVISHFLSLNA